MTDASTSTWHTSGSSSDTTDTSDDFIYITSSSTTAEVYVEYETEADDLSWIASTLNYDYGESEEDKIDKWKLKMKGLDANKRGLKSSNSHVFNDAKNIFCTVKRRNGSW